MPKLDRACPPAQHMGNGYAHGPRCKSGHVVEILWLMCVVDTCCTHTTCMACSSVRCMQDLGWLAVACWLLLPLHGSGVCS
jgi:hypothetical protein